jgi:tetratricopeptide (TPR) repeat protein
MEKQPDDSCIACHMPSKEASIQHTAITDHRIPRHPDSDQTPPAATDWPRQGQVPLVPFPAVAEGSETGSGSRTTSLAEADDEELSRDLGVALMELGHIHPAPWLGEMALPHLDRAVQDDENDFPAWDARAFALWITGRHEEALACCKKVLEKEPNRETTLFSAAMLAIRLNRPALTRSYAERGIKVNPKLWTNYQLLADLAAHGRDWEAAKKACQQAIRLQPSNILPHRLLITCYLQTGEKTKAQQELAWF